MEAEVGAMCFEDAGGVGGVSEGSRRPREAGGGKGTGILKGGRGQVWVPPIAVPPTSEVIISCFAPSDDVR